jgi:pimeloyl-ACP methyl ester carboxylesterase
MLWRAALSVPSPLTPLLIREGLRRFLDWRLFHDSRERRADIDHIVDMHCAPKDFEALLSAGRACVDAYTGELLEESVALERPVLMIWGRHDGLIPSAHADAFRRANGRAEVHVFGDCGHYPHLELPRRFNRVLGNWLGAPAAPLAARVA